MRVRVYGPIGMGVAMIYGVMNVPDFALGAKAMLGGYVAFFMTVAFHQSYGVGLAASIAVLAVVGGFLAGLMRHPDAASAQSCGGWWITCSRWAGTCGRTAGTAAERRSARTEVVGSRNTRSRGMECLTLG